MPPLEENMRRAQEHLAALKWVIDPRPDEEWEAHRRDHEPVLKVDSHATVPDSRAKLFQIFVHDLEVGNRIPQGVSSRLDAYTELMRGTGRALPSLKTFKDHKESPVQSAIVLVTPERAEAIRSAPCDPRWRVQVIPLTGMGVKPPLPAEWEVVS